MKVSRLPARNELLYDPSMEFDGSRMLSLISPHRLEILGGDVTEVHRRLTEEWVAGHCAHLGDPSHSIHRRHQHSACVK